MFDFSSTMAALDNENNTRETIPTNTVVFVRMEVIAARNPDHDSQYINVAGTGLRQLYCKFLVTKGTYANRQWNQFLVLPESMQKIALTDGQQTACKIGGSMLVDILKASQSPLQIKDISAFSGLEFPVKVKIVNGSNGIQYNAISYVITRESKEWPSEVANPTVHSSIAEITSAMNRETPSTITGETEIDNERLDNVPF